MEQLCKGIAMGRSVAHLKFKKNSVFSDCKGVGGGGGGGRGCRINVERPEGAEYSS